MEIRQVDLKATTKAELIDILKTSGIVVASLSSIEIRLAEFILEMQTFARDPDHTIRIGYGFMLDLKAILGINKWWKIRKEHKHLIIIKKLCREYRYVEYLIRNEGSSSLLVLYDPRKFSNQRARSALASVEN